MTDLRVNKYLAEAGVCSRRKADELVKLGKVKINERQAKLSDRVLDDDKVYVEDKLVKPKKTKIYYVLNKPVGVISSSVDEKGRKKVIDFAPKGLRLFQVGRLDTDSEGLIILTNDGDLAQKLSHPSFLHQKEYEVWIDRGKEIEFDSIRKKLLFGLNIDGKIMKVDKVENFHLKTEKSRHYIIFNLVLHTGYNRQIRKMCGKIGLSVAKLKRIRIGKLKLSDLNLKVGEIKNLNRDDIL
jgi:pseudouridine synthase